MGSRGRPRDREKLLANVLTFVGCFLETSAAMTILVPILLPIVLKLGISPFILASS
jgi:TRAP-type C4-dicarboxylate transport system permease large subunit